MTFGIIVNVLYTVKSVLVITSIKQPPVLSNHTFKFPSGQENGKYTICMYALLHIQVIA